ncbi:MAG TPA: glycosyltransferase 87 family protein, partial [Blastocatellia bacterium]|nr:glycosyltransferase 87 family protein [Blastocatellia bacterium]
AGLCLGLGTAAKLYPAVLIPVFCAYYIARGDNRSVRRLIAGGTGAVLTIVAPFTVIGSTGFFDFLRYHQMRGLHVESVPAGVLLLAHVTGLTTVQLTFDYGAVHLVSSLADHVLTLLPVLTLLVLGAVILAAFLRFRDERLTTGEVSQRRLIEAIVLCLLAFIATNKVLSPQYVIWLLPFAALLRAPHTVVLGIICILTIVIFPFDYVNLMKIQTAAVVLLNVRNLLVIVLAAWLLISRPAREREPPIRGSRQSENPAFE